MEVHSRFLDRHEETGMIGMTGKDMHEETIFSLFKTIHQNNYLEMT